LTATLWWIKMNTQNFVGATLLSRDTVHGCVHCRARFVGRWTVVNECCVTVTWPSSSVDKGVSMFTSLEDVHVSEAQSVVVVAGGGCRARTTTVNPSDGCCGFVCRVRLSWPLTDRYRRFRYRQPHLYCLDVTSYGSQCSFKSIYFLNQWMYVKPLSGVG